MRIKPMPYKKNYLLGPLWDTFIKKIFLANIKKKILRIYGPLWDTFIKKSLFAWTALGPFYIKKIIHNYKKSFFTTIERISSQL